VYRPDEEIPALRTLRVAADGAVIPAPCLELFLKTVEEKARFIHIEVGD